MPHVQDLLFVAFAIAIGVLLALDFQVGLLALLGAFLCGAVYLFAGMIPPGTESFGRRVFNSIFLACVLSCLVLIVPGTLGAGRINLQGPVLIIAAALPLAALCFEVMRTPNLMQTIGRALRWW